MPCCNNQQKINYQDGITYEFMPFFSFYQLYFDVVSCFSKLLSVTAFSNDGSKIMPNTINFLKTKAEPDSRFWCTESGRALYMSGQMVWLDITILYCNIMTYYWIFNTKYNQWTQGVFNYTTAIPRLLRAVNCKIIDWCPF